MKIPGDPRIVSNTMTKSKTPKSESRIPNPESRTKSNALINETSPYLLQHAHNPVHWYPWSEESLELARKSNKPILLSIGYSACHWCHVMAHESFENEDTARVMNEHFINIKVDREERPDIDKIYQIAQQLLTQRPGGWPLTMLLTPADLVPFFAGTYFPPEPRFGLPGFKELLVQIAELYKTRAEDIQTQNQAVLEALHKIQQPSEDLPSNIDSRPLSSALRELNHAFDDKFGGFGGAPKFPQPPNLEFLLFSNPHIDSNGEAMKMLNLTLMRMAAGGIYDQLGGGFCRYSVDQYWLIPHFEKMLYDNGQLLFLYSQAWHLTKEPRYHDIARETADWLIRDMQSPEGGFYSSLDADSEGEEGKFYVWTPDEVERILDPDEAMLFKEYSGLAGPANFEGRWHLYLASSIESISSNHSIPEDEVRMTLSAAKTKLLRHRENREWPRRDDKILTSWNSLAIKGMATAALRFDEQEYQTSALRALEFIHEKMWQENRLFASYKDGAAHLNAYLDDYVFLIDAILSFLAVLWDDRWLQFAQSLVTVLLDQFFDQENGGFYFTSHDHEKLLVRRRDFMDDATPSGNGIAVRVLLEMAHITGEHSLLDAAEKTLKSAWSSIAETPHAHGSLLHGLVDYIYPRCQVILRGNKEEISLWRQRCQAEADLSTSIYAIPGESRDLPGILAECRPNGDVIGYLCEDFACKPPFTELHQLISGLKR